MKRIGLVLFVLLISFFIKFSMGNLKANSFFLKVGCLNENREYSFFLETGCKQDELAQSPTRIPTQPIHPWIEGIALSEATPARAISAQPTLPPIGGVALCELAGFVVAQPILPQIEGVTIILNTDEDRYQKEYKIVVADFDQKRLNRQSEPAVFQEIVLNESEMEASRDFEAVTLQFDNSEVDVAIASKEIAENSVDEIATELDSARFNEPPNIENELVEAELYLAAAQIDWTQLPLVKEPRLTDVEVAFGDSTPVEPYAKWVSEEVKLEICGADWRIAETEICGFEEAPSTEKELIAAGLALAAAQIDWTQLALVKEPRLTDVEVAFGDSTPVEPYAKWVSEEVKLEICGADWRIAETEICGFEEAPSTEKELIAAGLDLEKRAGGQEIDPLKDPNGAETATDFGDVALAEGVEPFAGVADGEAKVEIADADLVIPEFECGQFREEPNTERELAAAVIDVGNFEALIELTLRKTDEPQMIPVDFGDAVIADGVAPYAELPVAEPTAVNAQVEWVIGEFECGKFAEEPNTERELAAAESVTRSVEVAFEQINEPQAMVMIFGDTAIESVEPYAELQADQAKAAVEQVEWVIDEYESGKFAELPNTDREFTLAQKDLRNVEVSLGIIEDPSGAENPMAFGDIVVADRLDSFAELPSGESSVEMTRVEWVIEDFECGEFREEPTTDQEFSAAVVDVRKGEERVEIDLASIEEPKLALTAFGDAVITEAVEPYAVVLSDDSKVDLGQVDWAIAEFEHGRFTEEPNTDQELSSAFEDVTNREVHVEKTLGLYEEPKVAPMTFGDTVIADELESYSESTPIKAHAEIGSVVLSIPDFDVVECDEVPNTERELADAEQDIESVKVDAAVAKIEEPKIMPMAFGNTVINDQVEPYTALPSMETEIEIVEAGWGISQLELETERKVVEKIEVPKPINRIVTAAEIKAEAPVAKPKAVNKVVTAAETKAETAAAKPKPVNRIVTAAEIIVEKPAQIAVVVLEEDDHEEMAPIEKEEIAPSEEIVIETGEVVPAWFSAWLASQQPVPAPAAAAVVECEAPQPPIIEVHPEIGCRPEACCYKSLPYPKYISIRHVWGDQEKDCIPFASNYTTLEMVFAPDYCLGRMMPLLDLRGHRFDNNTYAGNAGIGARYIPDPCCDCFCEIMGFNAYYDYRQGCIGYYQQVGVGLEILGRRWDLRANAYAPFGRKRHIQRCVFDDYDGDYYAIRDSIESISYSFNAELGFLVFETCNNFSLYAAAGPYFLARALCNDGVVGGEARLRPQYKDYLALDLSWRYDRLFETIWQVEIILNLPLYQLSCSNKYPCGISDRQIYQPIERFEVMPLSKRTCWFTNW